MKEEGEEGSGCRVQGSRKLGIRNEGGGFAASIYGAMPESIIKSLVT